FTHHLGIDARIHIYNQYMKNKKKASINKLVGNVIRNYGQVIREIKEKGLNVGVYNIVPPGPQDNIYNYPYYARWKTRLKITRMVNQQLQDFCRKNGVFFVDIFDQVVNAEMMSERSFRKGEYIFDDVHLNSGIVKLVLGKLFDKQI
ncbi:MAG: hypothetical protein M1308_17380, partial [Actinobacteria bacterium]|nr:hypothetical protein [Actinomycetota bacterium]